jgi:putative ABC transport system permease protein
MMNLFTLTLAYIRQRKGAALLNVMLLATGVGSLVALLLLSRHVEQTITAHVQGIDLVVGAKGSPLQVILSSLFHVDAPTGNIDAGEADALARHPMVRTAIPLALGDSYRQYRIVGTIPAYADLYGASIANGTWWHGEEEVVLGARVAAEAGLAPGGEIFSVHGLSGGDAHDDHPLHIVGVLAPTGTALDRLVLTAVETVWAVHGHEGEKMGPEDREYTALLLRYASPVAAALLPRYVDEETGMQAASPAYQTARLFALMGVGLTTIRLFAGILVAAAALSVFIGLYNALRERRYDIAILRTMGASRPKLFGHIVLEGVMLAVAGGALGSLLGHAGVALLGQVAGPEYGITGWRYVPEESWLVAGVLALGVLAALLPALQTIRLDISHTLARA